VRRIMLVVTVALVMAAMLVAMAMPAFAQAGEVEGLPEGQCAEEGGFVEKEQEIPPGSEGNFTLVNDSPERCFKELERHPDVTPLPDDAEIQTEDNIRPR
jgi:uncharacterized protein (DUF58 family)